MNIFWHSQGGIFDERAYRNAIRRCNDLFDYKSALRVFDLMKQTDTIQSIETVNALIACLCDCDRTELAFAYFDNLSVIAPNLNTFELILSSCQKRASLIKIAEKVWQKMIFGFWVKPSVQMCALMISVYAKAAMFDKAEFVWNRLRNDENVSNEICGQMILCFALKQDKDGMIEIMHFMKAKGFKLRSLHYFALIKYFLAVGDFERVQLIFNDSADQINEDTLYQIMTAFLRCNRPRFILNSLTQKYEQMIEENESLRALLFEAYLMEFEAEKTQIIKIVKRMMAKKQLSEYWTRQSVDGRDIWSIDLHKSWRRNKMIKFILHFVLENEWKYIQKMIDSQSDILILCGRGAHSDPRFRGRTKAQAQSVLLAMNPPIRSKEYAKNNACLVLDREDVLRYLKSRNDIDYA